MAKIIKFPDLRNIPLCLRNLADEIESGELKTSSITLASPDQVYHLGTKDGMEAIRDAIFNMTIGINTITNNYNGEH